MNMEIFKSKHRNRIYYANICNYCFQSLNKLRKCGACYTVSYCSREHQKKDWIFHKSTCEALKVVKKQVEYPKKCDWNKFVIYRERLSEAMAEYRGLQGSYYLTDYEKQICYFPWVCSLCFKASSKHQCENCRSVTYCSVDHKKQHRAIHQFQCGNLKFCRIVASLGYENGFRLNTFISNNYQRIRAGIKEFPKDTLGLSKLIQKEITTVNSEEDLVNMFSFTDPYIPAAIVINILETVGIIRKRKLRQKHLLDIGRKQPILPKKKYDKKEDIPKTRSLTVHFLLADDTELSFQWSKISQLLIDWITNIDKIRIILTGPKLQDYELPTYQENDKFEVIVYKKAFHEVENLPIPDVFIMFECHRAFENENFATFRSMKYQETLFEHEHTPVAFFSGDDVSLNRISEFHLETRDVKCLKFVEANLFTDSKISRQWVNNLMTIYRQNSLFSVFMKC